MSKKPKLNYINDPNLLMKAINNLDLPDTASSLKLEIILLKNEIDQRKVSYDKLDSINIELNHRITRLKAQLSKCKEQRRNATTCYYEQIYGQTKQGLIEIGRDELADDAEIEEIE